MKALQFLRANQSPWLMRLTNPTTGTAHFWQPGGGYDRNVNKKATAAKMIRYIHENPVRRGLVDSPTEWKWSSAAWYAGDGDQTSSIKIEEI